MLLAIYMYEGYVRYKRLNSILHLNRWVNKYFSKFELEFVNETDFKTNSGQEGLSLPHVLQHTKMLIIEVECIAPESTSVQNVHYNFGE